MTNMPEFHLSDYSFSEADVKRVLTSPEGQKLLRLLNRDGGVRLRQAAEALKRGDQAAAQQALRPVMVTEEAARLVQSINRE